MSPTTPERIAWPRRIPLHRLTCLAIVTLVLLTTLPLTPWEFDELLFVQGVVDFQPLLDHPAAPGYPLIIAAGKLMNVFFGDPFTALVAVSVIASIIGFLALAAVVGDILGSAAFGTAASLILYFSPTMLVHSDLALSDSLALALMSIALFVASRGASLPLRWSGALFGLAAAGAVGTRPQLCIAILPMLAVVLWRMRSWSERALALYAFTLTCLAWLVPLVAAAGGPLRWFQWERHQAGYFAAHDAAISRGGKDWLEILARFVAHPWGLKWVAVPILALAVAGAAAILRDGRWMRALPLIAAAIPYLIFAIFTMDPADAPRYAIPTLPLVALLSAAGLERLSAGARLKHAAPVLIAAYMFASVFYVRTVISERSVSPSPPAEAALWAKANIPLNAVILYDLSLRPHAEYLFRGFRSMQIDDGMRRFAARPDVPLYVLADGQSREHPGYIFSWPWSDAYGKITRDHYRVVSLIPLPPRRRYVPLDGIFPVERSVNGDEWRWMAPRSQFGLPDTSSNAVRLQFALSREAPFPDNVVTLSVDGRPAARVTVLRTAPATISLPLTPGPHRIGVAAGTSFVPLEYNAVARDGRRLAVKLLSVEQFLAGPGR